MALISIIMPAYNAEQYIEETIEGIIKQSFENWELIVVDDGSTDRSAQIIDKYAKQDLRIRAVHQKNEGVSCARNAGLDLAKGKYIVFVDADDVIPKTSLETRLKLADNADIVVAGYELFNENGVFDHMPLCSKSIWNNREAVQNIIAAGELGYQGYIFNKLFRKDIIERNEIRFEKGIVFNEDRLFCVAYAVHCNSARLTDDVVYRYRISQTNATSTISRMSDADIEKFMTEFKAFDLAMSMVKDKYIESYYLCAIEAQYRATVLKKKISKEARRIKKRLNDMIRKYGKVVLRAPIKTVGIQRKLKALGHIILLR